MSDLQGIRSPEQANEQIEWRDILRHDYGLECSGEPVVRSAEFGYTIYAVSGPEQGSRSVSAEMDARVLGIRAALSTQACNAVVIVVEPGGVVEPTYICGDIELHVSALQGEGLAPVCVPEADMAVGILHANDPAIYLRHGDHYMYRQIGRVPLVVLDVCFPPFQPQHEVPSDDPFLAGQM